MDRTVELWEIQRHLRSDYSVLLSDEARFCVLGTAR